MSFVERKIDLVIPKLKNSLFAKYALTRYFLLYALRLMLEGDKIGADALQNPGNYVIDSEIRKRFLHCVDLVLKDVCIDLNAELNQLGEDFDYRGKLRDEAWVEKLAHQLFSDYQKLVARSRINSFGDEFQLSVPKKVVRFKRLRT